ncbi:MAG: sugar-binding transcriptional regulator [Actinomycetota bacterium]
MTPDAEPRTYAVPDADSSAELIRAAAVARSYFIERLTKQAIAEQFGISRFKVARLLDVARDAGLVHIDIRAPLGIDVDLSQRVQRAHGLTDAWVVTGPEPAGEPLHTRLGRVGATMVAEAVEEDRAIGIAWGRTMRALVDALPALPRCPVVQVAGGLPHDSGDSAADLVRELARLGGGQPHLLHAPLFVGDRTVAASLRAEPAIATTLERFAALHLVLVGVGAWDPHASPVAATLKAGDIAALEQAHTVAEVCGLFINEAGDIVDTGLTERAMAINEEQLRSGPEVIAVAGGPEKATAVTAFVRSGLCSRLVTDRAAAHALLT